MEPFHRSWSRCVRKNSSARCHPRKTYGRDEKPMEASPTADAGVIVGRWWSWAVGAQVRSEVTFANYPLRGAHSDVAILCRTNAQLGSSNWCCPVRVAVCFSWLNSRENQLYIYMYIHICVCIPCDMRAFIFAFIDISTGSFSHCLYMYA